MTATAKPARYRFTGAPHAGMPPLDPNGPPLSWFEFLPGWLFYAPIWAYGVWLIARWGGATLPAVANPRVHMGGFVGESKSEILDLAGPIARNWIAPHILHRRDTAATPADQAKLIIQAAEEAGFALPFVLKPDIGCRGMGVQLAETEGDVAEYVAAFPEGAAIMAQRLCGDDGEAGVFYIRRPGEARGEIFSLTLKYFPYVVGDGRRSLGALIDDDPRAGRIAEVYRERHRDRIDWRPAKGEIVRIAFAGSHSRGTIFRNGERHVTEAMRARFDEICKDIPEFHFGRFDVRFGDIERLKAGEGFTIVEVNAAGGEATHIWDRNTRLFSAWRALIKQFRALFEIGAANRDRGFAPPTLREAWRAYRAHRRLSAVYPPTH